MLRVAFVILVLTTTSAAAMPAAVQQVRRARAVQQEPQQDSLVTLGVELERIANAQRALMRDYQRANTALSRASSDAERAAWRARVTALEARMERTIMEAEVLRAHMQAVCVERPGPEGYLGISFSEVMDVATSPSATGFTFKKYPTIVAVDPGSPAQKAGLTAGDEIMTLGTHDVVSDALDLAPLLKPGVQLPVRYRRDGLVRTLKVLIEPRPHGFMSGCPLIEVTVAPPVLAMQPRLRIIRPTPNSFGYVFEDSAAARAGRMPIVAATEVEAASARARETMTPVLPPTPYAPHLLQGALLGSNAIVFGAVLVPLSQELREGLGSDEGILVVHVLRGTPALEAGLRAGDIIVRVNGRKLASIPLLMEALEEARDRDVELQVSRKNAKARIVRLPR